MKRFKYNASTNTIWTSFDYGEVTANTIEEAIAKAKVEITLALSICNKALDSVGQTIDMDLSQIEVEEIKD